MLSSQRKINLTVPSSYHECSLRQLRDIVSLMLNLIQTASPLHPFEMFDFKLASFILLADIEIVSPVNPRLPVEQQYYEVRFRRPFFRRILDWFTGDNEPFSLYLWQIRYWLEPKKTPAGTMPGILDWLDPEHRGSFILCPFDYIRRRHSGWKGMFGSRVFKGPEPYLNGFTWQRFRFAQDHMENYIRQHNHYVALTSSGNPSPTDLKKSLRTLDTARASFLATIFEGRIRYADEHGRIRRDWRYQSNQSYDNIEYFRDFPDVDWQIILLWWSGTMNWLSSSFPKVIRSQKPGKGKPVNPAEVYARTTATLEKYIGTDADKLEKEPFDVVLRHLDNLIRENEEMERIRSKN